MFPLAEGEHLLWSGRPQRYPRRYADFHGYVAATVGFAALGALGVFASVKLGMELAVLALLPGFFGAAVAQTAERNRQRKLLLGVLTYLVTDRRLVFVADRPGGIEFRWVWLPDLDEPRLRDHGDGTGTVSFKGPSRVRLRDQKFQAQSSLTTMTPELIAIEEPEHVAELIARTLRALQPSGGTSS
ncbi:hypothetical protein [Amycolatopsis sp. Poz14]|uniref:hypothetical protein n=1 Tax=Amycolatopsis sp. Poz14 TaxID=1447705 RepID=UPI001EE8729E|nr:hypothetical protein [Amycolatopsis sp. Poz14]MCG3751372.1 hypothetical protein [Amycolatopsis sp. Poz14]